MRKTLHTLIALLALFSVATQFYLMLENRTTSLTEMIIRFFSFFTILTNTLVALYFGILSLNRKKMPGFLSHTESLTFVTVYIFVVGLVYQIALRHVWEPTGLQMVVDELLHTAIPILVFLYWALYSTRTAFEWNHLPKLLAYPGIYLVYILCRGKLSDFYPYPFLDVANLGWTLTLQNITVLFLLFIVLFLAFKGFRKILP
ncbi:Pr6Pr family membrane protein [Roseivirga sp. UBA1976]|uniref:Pr6Pr family membrane protein n=1 Tax=Roseivirga sp. UBA1976 TaxID=1947386 RepID=UPI0025798299|nr:Pr6Pr family membrane protein [Roseivirga sp. UBA1976]|tara:strand:- start:1969 stop:2574 length:606 start_codon:yes stop_codon:yes gene_type:complete